MLKYLKRARLIRLFTSITSRFDRNGDLVSQSLADLQDELHRCVAAAFKERDEARRAEDRMKRELSSLRHRLRNYEQKYQSVCEEKQIRVSGIRTRIATKILFTTMLFTHFG